MYLKIITKEEEEFPRTYRELSEISSESVKVQGYIFSVAEFIHLNCILDHVLSNRSQYFLLIFVIDTHSFQRTAVRIDN